MDISATIAPKSDQLNAEDLLAGPRTVTVAEVAKGASPEQPVDIVTAEFGNGRPYRPCKSMRRILVAAWGPDASVYVGRRITLFCDPSVTFGRDKVGGIRISHLSDIPKRLEVALTVTRGKRAPFVVEPLKAQAPAAAGGMSKDARAKWEAALLSALADADCTDPSDQEVVVGALAGRPDPIKAEHVLDDELRAAVGKVDGARKDGSLGDLISEILNEAAIRSEAGAEQ